MLCLVVPEEYKDTVIDNGIVFCCPGCHEMEDRATRSNGKRVFCPYWVSPTYLKTASD